MFQDAITFDMNVSFWDTKHAMDMSQMFAQCTSFRGIGSESWNVISGQDMSYMFEKESLCDGHLRKWDVSNVCDMTKIFADTISLFYGDGLENWKILIGNTTNRVYYSTRICPIGM
jgi:Mycoplasma protein of unknown function, DUF285